LLRDHSWENIGAHTPDLCKALTWPAFGGNGWGPAKAAIALPVVPVQQCPRIKQSAAFLPELTTLCTHEAEQRGLTFVKTDWRARPLAGVSIGYAHRKQSYAVRAQAEEYGARQMFDSGSRKKDWTALPV